MFCTNRPKKTEIQKPDYHGLSQEVGTCSSCASSFKRRAKAMGRKGNRARPAAVVTRAAADKAKEVATRAQKLMEEAVIAPGEIRDATKHAEVAVQGKAKAAAGQNKQTDALYIKASHKRRDYLKNKRNKYGIGWMNGHHW